MCGFAGIFYLNGRKQNIRNISSARDTLRHRGPDDYGYHEDENIQLSFNRLSIIDLSSFAHQPMCNEDGSIWLVFNGEIFNYIELMGELKLKNHIFKSKGDSESVIHSYEEYGLECLSRFNGMWGFVIYDKIKKRLFCGRDRYGIKPFYYYIDQDKIVFASEIKAILNLGIKAEPNEKQVFNYLAYAQLDISHETMFKNIYQIPPAHYMVIESGKMEIKRYWQLEDRENNRDIFMNNEETVSRFRDLFLSSVKLRLRSDVPIGILLSGGLDSSAVVSTTNKIYKEAGIPADIKTFTATYQQKDIDESDYARAVVKGTGIPNILVFPGKNSDISKDIKRVIYYQDEPTISMTVFAHWYLMEEIRKHNIKVIISGQGSDEMLGGYLEIFMGYHLTDLFSNHMYGKFFNEIKLLKNRSNMLYRIIMMQLLKAMVPRRIGLILKSYFRDRGISYLRPEFVKRNWHVYDYKNVMTKYSRLNESLHRLFTRESLPFILHYEDRNSMAFSIEQRMPFLDYRLVEFIFSLSNRQKIDGGISKIILRNSMKNIMPEKVISRYSKLGFTVPQNRWINEMESYGKDILNSAGFNQRSYWNPKTIRNLYSKQLKHKAGMDLFLWRVMACEIWHNIYFS